MIALVPSNVIRLEALQFKPLLGYPLGDGIAGYSWIYRALLRNSHATRFLICCNANKAFRLDARVEKAPPMFESGRQRIASGNSFRPRGDYF